MFELSPGEALHIPVTCPHWVKNGSAPSVSLSINYELPASTGASVYRANYFIRKLGMSPAPPGESPAKDMLKHAFVATTFSPVRGAVKRLRTLMNSKRFGY